MLIPRRIFCVSSIRLIGPFIDLHEGQRTRFRRDAPPAMPPLTASEKPTLGCQGIMATLVKPGVHTNDFAPIHSLRALKLGHASLATVFRPGRLTLQPILRENLESPVLRYQPITTAVVTDACLNTRWHHGAYTSAVLRESLGLDRVVTVYAELSRPDWLATVQSGRKQVQSRVCTPSLTYGDLVRPLTNNGAACYDSSSSLMKHLSFIFASSWCEN